MSLSLLWTPAAQPHVGMNPTGHPNHVTEVQPTISAEELDAAEAEIQDEDDETGDELELGTTVESSDMALMRDQMAKIMWEDYCSYIQD